MSSPSITSTNTVQQNWRVAAQSGEVTPNEVGQIVAAAADDGRVTKEEIAQAQDVVDSMESAGVTGNRAQAQKLLSSLKVRRHFVRDTSRLERYNNAHTSSVAQTTEARQNAPGAYQDLEISYYAGCTVQNGAFRGFDYCEYDLTQSMQQGAGDAKRDRVNADPRSSELMIEVSSNSEFLTRTNDYLSPANGSATVKNMEFHTGHGAMWPVSTIRSQYGDAQADDLLALGKREDEEVALLFVGPNIITQATLERSPDNALGLNWSENAQIDLAACQVGLDRDFVEEFQRVFSGGQATVYAATFSIPANGVDASARTSADNLTIPAKK